MNFLSGLFGGIGSALGGLGSILGITSGKKNKFDYSASEWQYQKQKELNEYNFNLQNQANIDMFNRQNQANIDMWNMQKQANIDMWNMQNEYNLPTNQMARLKDAGLNPNLVYGSVGAGNAQALSAGSLSAGSLSAGSLQSPHVSSPVLMSTNKRKELANLMLSSARFFTELELRNKMLDLQAKNLANDNIRIDNDIKRVNLLQNQDILNSRIKTQQYLNYGIRNNSDIYKQNYLEWYNSLPWYKKLWTTSPDKVIKFGLQLGSML